MSSRFPRVGRVFAVFLLSFGVCGSLSAQEAPDAEPPSIIGEGRLSFLMGVPLGEFRDNTDRLGFGGSVFGGLRIGASPVVFGVDLGFLVYGRSVDTVPFSSTVGPRVQVEVVTTNNIVEPHLVLRLQPADGQVRPYLDGLFGFKYLFTETRVRDEDRFDDEDIASTTNFQDLAVSGGIGGGLDVRVYRGGPKQDVRTVSVHLGVQYLLGGRAEYLAEGPLEDTNGNGELDDSELNVQRSTTPLLQPQIGATLQF